MCMTDFLTGSARGWVGFGLSSMISDPDHPGNTHGILRHSGLEQYLGGEPVRLKLAATFLTGYHACRKVPRVLRGVVALP